jgi:DNA-directed RNA polymerase specialized sigma24 family protein
MASKDRERRRAILSDPKIHAAIRSVARMRGVPTFELDDVVNEVIADACEDDNVPLGDVEQARLYLRACSRHKAIDRARVRIREMERHVVADPNLPAVESAPPEDRAFVRRLLDAGKSLFPRTHRWFERVVLDGESHVSIAAEASVSPGHVRHEVSVIRRSLRALGTVAAACVVLVFGLQTWSIVRLRGFEPTTHPAPQASAQDLRELAKGECGRENWAVCAEELRRASVLDPNGDTPALHALLEMAERRATHLDASPGH